MSNFDGLDTRARRISKREEIGIDRHSLDNDRELPINRSALLRFTFLFIAGSYLLIGRTSHRLAGRSADRAD